LGLLRTLVEARLAPDRLRRVGVLGPAAVRALLDDHLGGRVERGRTLWPALRLRMRAEFWVHRAASAAPPTAARRWIGAEHAASPA